MAMTVLENVTLNGEKKNIFIKDNKIHEIGEGGPYKKKEGETIIPCEGKAILPAFYNCHTHSPMVLLKGRGEDKILEKWLAEDMFPAEAKFNEDIVYHASKFAILEMIKGGTVFFNDMYYFPEATKRAIEEMGIRGAICSPQIDFINGRQIGEEELKKKKEEIEEFAKLKFDNPRLIKVTGVHSVYTLSNDLLKFYSEISKKYKTFLHIHACETEIEVKTSQNRFHKSPIQVLEDYDLLRENTILAHCVHLTEDDIKLIKKYGCTIAHCPVSNYKLVSGQFRFDELLEKGIRITLGTDGSASNNNLSMIEEMKVCALNAKMVGKAPYKGKVDNILETATINGAKAFNIEAGKIEVGKYADFILVNLNHIQLLPNHNLKSNMIYSAHDDVITDVFCDGKQIMKDRKVENEDEIIKNFKAAYEQLQKILNESN